MKHINELLQRYKIKDTFIAKKYKKYYEKYKDTTLQEENNQLIYEVMFFYIASGIDYKYTNLQQEYKIKSKIFQTAAKIIKTEVEEASEEDAANDDVCNLYAITKNINDYRM